MEFVLYLELVETEQFVDGQVVAFGDRVVRIAFFHGVVGVAVVEQRAELAGADGEVDRIAFRDR